MAINGGEIVAISTVKKSWIRANVLVIDEFLLMNEELVERSYAVLGRLKTSNDR
jgi:hypothetical protein